eukprot:TRINITY_DN35355_c0_g1_i1.p1 TRINITY_DN35355_c0_g1~~TRINITY_DN35355_c0_g1_i1.p1  ORF type:complete len:407 (+),score=80.14 TRINITY_DN35355_c0_g1_i1:289-1509(+)
MASPCVTGIVWSSSRRFATVCTASQFCRGIIGAPLPSRLVTPCGTRLATRIGTAAAITLAVRHARRVTRRPARAVAVLRARLADVEASCAAGNAVDRVATDVVDEVIKGSAEMTKRIEARVNSLQRQRHDPAEADVWQAKGMALQSLPMSQWHNGLQSVNVDDWQNLDEIGNPTPMLVELDPKKNFQDNAKVCFKKSKKILRALENVKPLLDEAEADLERWKRKVARAAAWREAAVSQQLDSEAMDGVLRVYRELVNDGVLKKQPPLSVETDSKQDSRRAFRRKHGKNIDCFRSPGGHEVVAGRSSKMNEHVSLKLAKSDQIWFHTADVPGSHVLLRARWGAASDEDIKFAASIAAHYSKAKGMQHVDVMYCKGSQVKKIKGTPTGMVSISGSSQHIIVEPALPPE